MKINKTTLAMSMWLVQNTDKEIGWYLRLDEDGVISGLPFVYPQETTSATVTALEPDFTKWIMSHQEEGRFFDVHCHSHVNFSPEPSFVDEKFRRNTILTNNPDFYCAIIFNKKKHYTCYVYEKGKGWREEQLIPVLSTHLVEHLEEEMKNVKTYNPENQKDKRQRSFCEGDSEAYARRRINRPSREQPLGKHHLKYRG